LAAFAAGLVVATPIVGVIVSDALPQGSDVFGVGPRIAAGVGSGVTALVIIGGAVWSAVQLLLGRRRSAAAPVSAIPAGRLAAANLLIAAGTIVLSAGGLLNSVVDEMDAFAISLVVGIAIIFAGFLLTTVGTPAARTPPPIRGSLEPGPLLAADGVA